MGNLILLFGKKLHTIGRGNVEKEDRIGIEGKKVREVKNEDF